MNNKSFLITAVMVFVFCSVVYGQPWDGNGVEGDPYQIGTAEDIIEMSNDPNNLDKHFVMIADVNMVGYTFTTAVIGTFKGVFDGADYKIYNLTIDTAGAGTGRLGLFNTLSSGEVKNLGLENVSITGGNGSYWVGGLCGWNYSGTITNCYSEGSVIGGDNSGSFGGLCGYNCSTISNSYATGLVSGGDNSGYVGGLCGLNSGGLISNCYSEGSVIGGNGSVALGGLCGYNYYSALGNSTIINCYAISSVTGGDNSGHVGGLCGLNTAMINNCYSESSVKGGYNSSYIGGLCGENYCTEETVGVIDHCYSTGLVGGGNDSYWVGGLCGYNYQGTISNSYSTGSVTGTSNVGGFVGCDATGIYTKSFWDMTVNPTLTGIGNTTDPNVIGESTTNMQTQSTFTDAGWDFVDESANGIYDIWRLCNEGTEYPQLNWQYPLGDFGCPDGVNMLDFAILGDAWFTDPNMPNWDPACDISEPNDNFIDGLDLDVFTGNYLTGL